MEPVPQDWANTLRKYEPICYQIAFYLLEKEEDAVRAAANTLRELGRDRCFFLEEESEQRRLVKTLAIKHALAYRTVTKSNNMALPV